MAKLTVAVPSKGRIMDAAYAFFAEAGIPIERPATAREYVGKVKGVAGVEVLFMSSSEIAANLVAGTVHLGVTGEDLLREASSDLDASVALIKALAFGYADVVVAVPGAWIDVANMADLDDVCAEFRQRHKRPLRVATKYSALTRRFFATHGLTDYRIVESTGATEGAPTAGLAEIIVDITTTGATLAANNLKLLRDGVILKSQAQLAASLNNRWTRAAKDTLARVLDMVAAHDKAASTIIVRFQLAKKASGLIRGFEQDGCVIAKSPPPEGELQCPQDRLYGTVRDLRSAGARGITVRVADYLFGENNPLYDDFEQKLKNRK
ncbi:MAG: ATP phosphoribosyltransferase [Alphaproteobacteria bacterium]|nr:MAG: ATP phosphoribosyltransferase [Alphaproteobacteria bacterium]